ncbi:multidrug ABC transporter permease [Acrocarpospora corrugata]|uniref:Transport permease protein n=1 Tax=Acrocarpospora corrugata TaxID=35763 RepID=A0A5M3W7J1_9ACTN|nr:ABC transporter permease [Acrocarpospora corrugata]GES03173.1 multidrug ABC transporter permease [Acrocarpospora corrugata]
MIATLIHTGYMTQRQLISLFRQRWLVATNLIEPFIWLALFSAVFQRVVDIPGFGAGDYVDFLMPGIAVMTVLFASVWNGVLILQDIERGTLDRLLTTPVARSALISGPVLRQAVGGLVPTSIILGMGVVLGARYEGGVIGIAVFLLAVVAFGIALSIFSNVIALLVRKEETLVGLVNFTMMPLTFLSTTFMPANLVPGWVTTVAQFNPVNWAVEVGRQTLGEVTDWSVVLSRLGLLVGLGMLLMWGALAALRRYQRDV